MKVDANIKKALDAYCISRNIRYCKLAERFGISAAAVSKWRIIGGGIADKYWTLLFPMIKDYLPPERIFVDESGVEGYFGELVEPPKCAKKYTNKAVPMFGINDLSCYDNTLTSITDFAQTMECATSEFRGDIEDISGVFAIHLNSDRFSPVLPNKTRIFINCKSTVKSGDMVLMLQQGEKPTLAKYFVLDEEFLIKPLDGGTEIRGLQADAQKVLKWVFPVIQYTVYLA